MSEQPATLPKDTRDKVLRQQWANLAKTLKGGDRLSKTEWELFLSLTRELSNDRQDGEPDFFAEAEAAGAFSKDRVPRPDAVQMKARIARVAHWSTCGESEAFMLAEARKLWGVGYHSVRHYRQRAAALMEKELELQTKKTVAEAFCRFSTIYKRALAKDEFRDAIDAVKEGVALTGFNPAQKVEISGPNGEPFNVFDVPEKEPVR